MTCLSTRLKESSVEYIDLKEGFLKTSKELKNPHHTQRMLTMSCNFHWCEVKEKKFQISKPLNVNLK